MNTSPNKPEPVIHEMDLTTRINAHVLETLSRKEAIAQELIQQLKEDNMHIGNFVIRPEESFTLKFCDVNGNKIGNIFVKGADPTHTVDLLVDRSIQVNKQDNID